MRYAGAEVSRDHVHIDALMALGAWRLPCIYLVLPDCLGTYKIERCFSGVPYPQVYNAERETPRPGHNLGDIWYLVMSRLRLLAAIRDGRLSEC